MDINHTFKADYPVTVIISVYRELDYVERCINSLIKQTFQSFEFILIDDCGGNGAFERARKIADNSILADRTRYIVHQRNMGIAFSRNTGMDAATGEYMLYLDSDDFFEPDMIELLYNAAVKHNADLVISDFIREMPRGVSVYAKDTFDHELITGSADKERYIEEMLTSVKGCTPWNKLVKREVYIKNDIRFHDNMRDDLSVTPILVWHAQRIAFVNKALVHFVQYNTASGTFSFNHLPFVANALVHLETFFKSKGLDYTDIFLRYKANTKRKILMHPKPEMTQEQMFGLFPEVDNAIKTGKRLEPKIQYQLVLQLATRRNKVLFRIYRKSLLVLLKAFSLVSQ